MGDLTGLGRTTRGIWTRRQALEVVSRGRVDGYVARGEWQTPWPGIYADAGVVLDPEQRGFAAVLASGGEDQPYFSGSGRKLLRAVAAGRTAARIHGLPLVDDADPALSRQEHLLDDVVVSRQSRPLTVRQPDGSIRVLARHRRRLPGSALRQTTSGLYLTSPLQTLVDCARLLTHEALVCAIDHALHRDLVTLEELEAAVIERHWVPGVTALRSALGVADGRAESPNETLVRLVLAPHLPGLIPQHRLRDARGRILARFDLGDPVLRLAVEADGRRGHAGDRMAARDQKRDRVSDGHGWRTERCTWYETRCQQNALVLRMLEAAAAQARRHHLR